MDRRAFLMLVCGSVLGAPFVTEGQQTGRMWRIRSISVTHTKAEDMFFQQLRELGYVVPASS